MLSRITYTFRETWASFRRNMTLTVAAIITSAVSLLIFGLTLLMQHGFDNLLLQWSGRRRDGHVLQPARTAEQLAEIEAEFNGCPSRSTASSTATPTCALAHAQKLFAGDPRRCSSLTVEQHPHALQGQSHRHHQVDAL